MGARAKPVGDTKKRPGGFRGALKKTSRRDGWRNSRPPSRLVRGYAAVMTPESSARTRCSAT
ncbi:hypothetical protein LBMAG44_03430 [Gemmatimonadota bacterium]|nr:hypothetical protein LBMAG44_03430 [Gemmatimonadota bacterium]